MPFDNANYQPTAAELMATPDHMLAWLRLKDPREVVVRSMYDNCRCLAATFLRANGFPKAHWGTEYGFTGEAPHDEQINSCDVITGAIRRLYGGQVTAKRAIKAIEASRSGAMP